MANVWLLFRTTGPSATRFEGGVKRRGDGGEGEGHIERSRVVQRERYV
jgi:hypothetical protein